MLHENVKIRFHDTLFYKQPSYKQLPLRDKSFKQLSQLSHLARINSQKSIESSFCNVASKNSAIV